METYINKSKQRNEWIKKFNKRIRINEQKKLKKKKKLNKYDKYIEYVKCINKQINK